MLISIPLLLEIPSQLQTFFLTIIYFTLMEKVLNQLLLQLSPRRVETQLGKSTLRNQTTINAFFEECCLLCFRVDLDLVVLFFKALDLDFFFKQLFPFFILDLDLDFLCLDERECVLLFDFFTFRCLLFLTWCLLLFRDLDLDLDLVLIDFTAFLKHRSYARAYFFTLFWRELWTIFINGMRKKLIKKKINTINVTRWISNWTYSKVRPR